MYLVRHTYVSHLGAQVALETCDDRVVQVVCPMRTLPHILARLKSQILCLGHNPDYVMQDQIALWPGVC